MRSHEIARDHTSSHETTLEVHELGPRAANVLLAFNNFPAAASIPMLGIDTS